MSELRARHRKRDVPVVKTGGFHLPVFRRRAAFYVDGFNLFHAIEDLQRPYLHWLDLKVLARTLAPRSEAVRRVTWVTAFRPQARNRLSLHQTYAQALFATGVHGLLGHFVVYGDHCNACGHRWNVAEEKQSDVNLALSLVDDAHEDRLDVCYLVTTDGDHAATARFLKERFPHKRLILVTPPNRTPNRMLLDWADAQVAMTEDDLQASLLPANVRGILRPAAFEPPFVPRRKGGLTLVSSN